MKGSINKNNSATAIAILFHIIGFVGIIYFDKDLFTRATQLNLLLMFILLLLTQKGINKQFIVFFLSCYVLGMLAEITGTNTGWLFGQYSYGNVLGKMLMHVPWIIGINWIIIIYCCGITMQAIYSKVLDKWAGGTGRPGSLLKLVFVIIDGAILAVCFDWLMEPVAVKLGYWKWSGGDIPFYNYICWFVLSVILLGFFQVSNFTKQNKFAVHLFLIQLMFFLLLRVFL